MKFTEKLQSDFKLSVQRKVTVLQSFCRGSESIRRHPETSQAKSRTVVVG